MLQEAVNQGNSIRQEFIIYDGLTPQGWALTSPTHQTIVIGQGYL